MRHLYTGTEEYLTVTVTATVELNTQAVAFRFGTTGAWITAAWTGTADERRQARALMTAANLPAAGTYDLYVRVTSAPETPVVVAGQVTVH